MYLEQIVFWSCVFNDVKSDQKDLLGRSYDTTKGSLVKESFTQFKQSIKQP